MNAEQFQVVRGIQVGGDISDTFDSDDSYLKFYPGITLNPMEPPVWIEFIGTASNSSPNVLSFIVESNANTPGVQQTIELFDFSNNLYQTVDSRATTLSDSEVQVVLDDDASRFVEDGSNQVKARIGITSDPNSDNDGTDAMVVGTVLLSNQSSDAGVLSSIRQNPNSRPDVAPAPAWVLTTCSGPTKMRMGDRIDGSFQ